MIMDDPRMHFVCIFSRDTVNNTSDPSSYMKYNGRRLMNKEYLEHWGKWVTLDSKEKIGTLACALDAYVESGKIPCCKFDRQPLESFGMTECVMCVYCDDRNRDEVWGILESLGVKEKAWTYEWEVMEKWSPGGPLLERWLASQGMEGEAAEKIREEARRTFDRKYIVDSALAQGWQHLGAH